MEEFEILPETVDELHILRSSGFLLIVVTNQPDLATGALDPRTLEEMHLRLRRALPLDDVLVCRCMEHDPGCDCYKPRPGMLLDASTKLGINLGESFMVGDRWRDIGAGRAAGCRTIFLDRGYERDPRPESPDFVVSTLAEAREIILGAMVRPPGVSL